MIESEFDIFGLDHVQLAMPIGGEPLARGFYRDILGLAEDSEPQNLAQRGGCWFSASGLRIHLGVESDFRAARKAHPGLLVRGLAALRARLDHAGFTTTDDEPLAGYDRCDVDDPFGNRLELMERR
jgi:catechol 2,3-dioxygenase-like lactoylglutathione lyase family enzyme